MGVMNYLFGAHCIYAANSIVRDEEWSCSGECVEQYPLSYTIASAVPEERKLLECSGSD